MFSSRHLRLLPPMWWRLIFPIVVGLLGLIFCIHSLLPKQVAHAHNELPLELIWNGYGGKTTSVAWGDIDADGDLDLALGNLPYGGDNPNPGGVVIYFNDGSDNFTQHSISESQYFNTMSVAWGDMDGDGDLDLAVGNGDYNLADEDNHLLVNQIFENNGEGKFTLAVSLTSELSDTRSVAWGDMNGDGYLDLAVGNYRVENLIYINNGNDNNRFTTLITLPNSADTRTRSVAWGDMDGDGDLDLAVGNLEAHNQIYINNGDGRFTSNQLPGINDTTSVAWGDMDNDGYLDLAVGNWKQEDQIFRNEIISEERTLTLIWQSQFSDDVISETNSIAWGDMDGDGDLDLAVGNGARKENQIYINHSTNSNQDESTLFETIVLESTDQKNTESVAWGDIDNDGDLDLIVGNGGGSNPYGQASKVYKNIGFTNYLTESSALSEIISHTRSIAWGDIDGDGDLDLAVGNYDEENQIFENDGNGNFTSYQLLENNNQITKTNSVAWGDMDNDGDLDLAIGNDGSKNQVFENDGFGNFSEKIQNEEHGWSVNGNTKTMVWGDIDNDGDLDLAVGNDGGENQIFENDGFGNFSEKTQNEEHGWSINRNTKTMAWGDMETWIMTEILT